MTALNSNASPHLWHVARQSSRVHQEALRGRNSFENIAAGLRQQYTGCIDIRRRKKQDLNAEQEKRSQIDAERVQILTERITSNRNKQSSYNRQYGDVEGQLRGLEEELGYVKDNLRKAENEAKLNETARLRSAVAEDLQAVASGALSTPKSVYVERVSGG